MHRLGKEKTNGISRMGAGLKCGVHVSPTTTTLLTEDIPHLSPKITGAVGKHTKSPGVIFICHLILKPVSRGSVLAPTPYLWEGGMGIRLFVREKQVEIHMRSCDTSHELFKQNSK